MKRDGDEISGRSFWEGCLAPDADAIAELAEAAIATIPEPLRSHLEGLVFRVEEFPADEILDDLGIEDPFDLLGLYQGLGPSGRDSGIVATGPDMVFLYRRPILDYWAAGEEPLDRLVRHVLIHEVGHHFGLSDADMARIEAGEP
ncbi:MAG: hypothetical protein Kow00104_16580 [Rhodothalassiaceae bacterium]